MTGKQREADSQRRCYCSCFKEGSGARNQGMWAAFQAGEGEVTVSPEASRRNKSCQQLESSPVRL